MSSSARSGTANLVPLRLERSESASDKGISPFPCEPLDIQLPSKKETNSMKEEGCLKIAFPIIMKYNEGEMEIASCR